MRTLADIATHVPANLDTGLPVSAVEASRHNFGRNTLTPLPREPLWHKFLEKFDEPIIKILLAAALLSMIVDLFKASPLTGGIALGVLIAALVAIYALRQGQWAPTLMFVSALALFGVGAAEGHFLVEGLAVMIAVILATGVAFASEYKSDREFEVLNAHKESIQAKVLRDGQTRSVPIEDIVVGDVVILETGDEIPADGRLIKATELQVDQSLMTGESEPVAKVARLDDIADGPGCVFRGTQVVDGAAHMLITEVGDQTALGHIARRLLDAPDDEDADADSEETHVKRKLTISKELTPLQQKLTRLADLISRVGYAAAVLIFVAQLIRGIVTGEVYWPANGKQVLEVLSELLGYFVTMVIVIVVAVPEGLPMSVTVSLALAMQKMTRANSLVRQLVACETIGSATVICSDKTGTMTQNKMRVERLSWADHVCERSSPAFLPCPPGGEGKSAGLPSPSGRGAGGEGGSDGGQHAISSWEKLTGVKSPSVPPSPPASLPGGEGRPMRPIDWLALISAVNSTANLEQKLDKTVTIGSSTEGALLHWLREAGIAYGDVRAQNPPLYQIHFSSERKHMTTVVQHRGRLFALVKGAPEALIDSCTQFVAADNAVATLDDITREAIRTRLQESALMAMRTLAFAYAPLPADTKPDKDALHALRESLHDNLVYVGFVAIRDPLRDDVKDAVQECRAAGIDIKMITGDAVETARAIGYEIGLVGRADEPIDVPNAAVLTSQRLGQLSDDELKQNLPALRIVARARPLDKYRLVRLLQELGEVVAVTGDGTNDAPALKRADVGLAMGIAGTEVSKEASKIVLLDDAFSTIVKAVHWGRSLYENIQRFIQFQLTINVSALAITFLGILLFNVKAPFTVLQLLWINVIMDTFASIALCSEPPRPGVMRLPPKKRDENILTPAMVRTIFITAGFFLVVMLVLLVGMKQGFLRGDGPWSVEVGASRIVVAQSDLDLKHIEGEQWTYRGQSANVTFTVAQVALFFSIYVFFQVWNQINCRALTPGHSGLHRILRNPTFLAIAGVTALGQILIVTFGGRIFNVEPLGVWDWLGVIAFTSSVLVFAEIMRRIRLATSRARE